MMERRTGRRTLRRAVRATRMLAAIAMVTACSSSPAPESAPDPAPAPEAAAPAGPLLSPAAAAGSYRLRTEIERQGGRPRRGRSPAVTQLVLSRTPSAAPQMGAPVTTFNATVQIPGYTRAARGRSGQASAWWPVAGDSVVVQFANQRGDFVQLRGKREGRTLSGELWYLSMETGATFQLGTFVAERGR